MRARAMVAQHLLWNEEGEAELVLKPWPEGGTEAGGEVESVGHPGERAVLLSKQRPWLSNSFKNTSSLL